MKESPLVSVAMNAHNSTEFLEPAIASALAQTVRDLEVVVWDNASSDGAQRIVESFNDSRIRYIFTEPKTPLYQARCDAIRACRGQYVAFLDCDDLWAPNKLEAQLASMGSTGAIASCSDYLFFFEGTSDPTEYFEAYSDDVVSLRDALLPYRVGMSCLVARLDVLLDALPDPAPDWFFIEDLDIVSRLLVRGEMSVVHSPLMSYRFHGSNASRDRGAYVRELLAWVDSLGSRGIDPITLKKLNTYYGTQAAREQLNQLLSRGRRHDALRVWWTMPWTPTKAKWSIALVLPAARAKRRT